MPEDFKTAAPPSSRSLSCEEAERLLSRRIDGELDDASVPVLEEHIARCEQCRARAGQWLAQAGQTRDALADLWKEPPVLVPAAHSASKPVLRRRAWMPVGVAASQGVALAGLVAYFAFFGLPASAPRYVGNKQETNNSPANAARQSGSFSAAPAASPRNKAEPRLPAPKTAEATIPPEIPMSAVGESSAPARDGQALAAVGETGRDLRVDNVSMLFHVQAGNGRPEMSGRVFLYGDISGGNGWVRILDGKGRWREYSQSDLAAVPAPLQPLVKHFLAECSRPELHGRLKHIRNE